MGSYNPPTTDAWDVIRRHQEMVRQRTAEALRVGGTQPFQTTRKTQGNIRRIDEQQDELEEQQRLLQQQQEKLEEQQEQLAQQQEALGALVQAIPVTRIQQSLASGYSPSEGWQTVAEVSMGAPDGKPTSVTHAIGTVDFLYTSNTAGVAVFPVPRVRVVIAGEAGPSSGVRGNYDLSGSTLKINYAGTAQHVRGVGGQVVAQLQVSIDWPEGDRGSYSFSGASAQLVLTATFTP